MKALNQAKNLLNKFQETYGIDLSSAQQGSDVWHQARLGVITASRAKDVVAKATTATRATYMAELIAAVGTGLAKDLNFKQMEWGHAHEDAARSSYEFITGDDLTEVPFVFKDETFRIGASPDSFSPKRGVEIKCPYDSTHYILFATEGKAKSEWLWQVNFSMWVCGLETWDLCQFDPRMRNNPLHIRTIERDEAKIKTLEDAVPQFISDMDKKLEYLEIGFGDQWLLTPKPEVESA